jgi:hypothetical protein
MLKVVVFQYEEAPVVLTDVTRLTLENEDVEIVSAEGTLPFNVNDIMEMKLEQTDGRN